FVGKGDAHASALLPFPNFALKCQALFVELYHARRSVHRERAQAAFRPAFSVTLLSHENTRRFVMVIKQLALSRYGQYGNRQSGHIGAALSQHQVDGVRQREVVPACNTHFALVSVVPKLKGPLIMALSCTKF